MSPKHKNNSLRKKIMRFVLLAGGFVLALYVLFLGLGVITMPLCKVDTEAIPRTIHLENTESAAILQALDVHIPGVIKPIYFQMEIECGDACLVQDLFIELQSDPTFAFCWDTHSAITQAQLEGDTLLLNVSTVSNNQVTRTLNWQEIPAEITAFERRFHAEGTIIIRSSGDGWLVNDALFTPSQRLSFDSLSTPLTRNEVENFIGVEFPAAATDIYTEGEIALDTMVITRFDLPQSDVPAYLDALGITKTPQRGRAPFYRANAPFSEADEWWQVIAYEPDPNAPYSRTIDAEASYAGLRETVEGKNFIILIENVDADVVTIYMQVFNT